MDLHYAKRMLYFRGINTNITYLNVHLFLKLFFEKNEIHFMQGWTATMKHEVTTTTRGTKRLKHTKKCLKRTYR